MMENNGQGKEKMNEKSKVYYSDLRTGFNNSLLDKLGKLIERAGISSIDMDGKFVAIKIHFGEPGNLAFLRPNWARVVTDKVRSLGGKPFLTDCNTLYVGGRKNALDHIDAAYSNGFVPYATGAHVIIADGLKGNDETEVEVKGAKHIGKAKIGKAIMDADVVISLTHFKGHESTGFGGALKNLGMGSGSRAGKMEMHAMGKARASKDLCIGCRRCEKICAHGAPTFDKDGKCSIDQEKCVGCGRCISICPKDAIEPASYNSNDELNCRMMEYAKAVVDGRPCFHISIAVDISPNCDCHNENDMPIIPNVGLFASFDPVALDQAAADMCNSMAPNRNSALDEVGEHTHDHFHDIHPDTNWKQGLEYAEEIGLGHRDYELVKVK